MATRAAHGAERLTWLGHATVLLEVGGVRLLTDPVLRERIAHLRRQVPVPDLDPEVPPDAVLISHGHRDHLDVPTLRRLRAAPLALVPRGRGSIVSAATRGDVMELRAGDALQVGGAHVTAVPAVHDGRRSPRGKAADTLGFVVRGRRTVYFAGDTEPFAAMADLAPLDIALLPIWGWGPTLGDGHMDPTEAASTLPALRPRIAVPIHWGTLYPVGMSRYRPGPLEDPPHAFVRAAATTAPEVEIRVLAPGEGFPLP